MIWIGLPDDTPSKQLLNAASSYSIFSPSTPPSVGQEIMNTSYGEHEQQQMIYVAFLNLSFGSNNLMKLFCSSSHTVGLRYSSVMAHSIAITSGPSFSPPTRSNSASRKSFDFFLPGFHSPVLSFTNFSTILMNSWPSFDRGFRRSRDSTRLPIRLKEEVVGDLDFHRLSLCLCFCNILVNIPYHVIIALLSEDSCLIDLLGYQFIMSFVEQRRWSMRQFGPYQPSACDPW
ncbi:LOW QUALITY PROTEIN: hypothetical protein NC653_016387 [Populus alba x Populus x berolinensis]|uniref:Uncharacterized protein n=1 Tax=Populus alba x Populus x berolinensis TaxID=444605 RepID=A0AAD6QMZ1_9ROSI|nr:LOW QUALITY PROTEIN: hypothetical protein NC653_016387 [Populus alba x Populus x berolinensis]